MGRGVFSLIFFLLFFSFVFLSLVFFTFGFFSFVISYIYPVTCNPMSYGSSATAVGF